jgi:quinol monooxygenase YgiN
MTRTTNTTGPTTLIRLGAPHLTTITFLHVDPAQQDAAVELATDSANRMTTAAGAGVLNVLRSLDGSRVCVYGQWDDEAPLRAADAAPGVPELHAQIRALADDGVQPRLYAVVYADDRSPAGVSVIDPTYTGAIFINEITTQPPTQDRLLELVIANNEKQSLSTPGYRSANFHKSTDGERAVNFSLWDSPEHCIDAISRMADMDENLDETVQIAEPDFRFYALAHAVRG